MKRKGILKRTILIALVAILVLSCAVSAYALNFSGDGVSGRSASSSASGAHVVEQI